MHSFANAENRELDARIKQKEVRLENVNKALVENKGRVEIMQEHLHNVRQELLHTQGLVDAKKREISTEEHMKNLAERSMGGERSAIVKLQHVKEDLQDKLNIIQNAIFKGNEKMDRFKLQMNWNQEELEQWALAAKQKEEDHLALQKYTRADEVKIKELTLKIEKLTTAVSAKKADLDDEVTETQAKQIELDKTAEEFRQLHRERQDLVKQWQEAIEAMKRRDKEIERAGEKFAAAKRDLQLQQEILEDTKHLLDQHIQDNAAVLAKQQQADRVLQKVRDFLLHDRESFVGFKAEVELLKIELAKAAQDLMVCKAANANEVTVLEAEKVKLERERKRYQGVKRRLRKRSSAHFGHGLIAARKAASMGVSAVAALSK